VIRTETERLHALVRQIVGLFPDGLRFAASA
jgi:hypothetical protein